MRNRLWNNLQEAKFKSEYLSLASKRAYIWGNFYSFFLAISSAGCVAAWSIWENYPIIWALIVALSQVLILAKPYLPFIKNDRELLEMSYKYDSLYIHYEKLWFKNEKPDSSETEVESTFYKLRDSEVNFSKQFKQVYCPDFSGLSKKVSEQTTAQLNRIFN